MKFFFNFLVLIFCCFFCKLSVAQISFSDKTFLLSNENHHSGVAMSIIDMNGDGLDDIVRLDQGTFLNIELQTLPNQKFIGIDGLETGNRPQWAMCAADVDNDGVNEILTGGTNDDVVIVKVDIDNNEFSLIPLPKTFNIFLQGTNFADINNDSYVDIFGCHDNGESRIWGNDGDGNFVTQDDWIDMSINGNSGEPASGNYGSTWLDIDNDGDIDLYIAKCRQNVNNVNDKRRINQLYINDGNGNFTEEANSRGLAIGWQSWTADFQDINNDGWLDCFITNHDHEAQMLLNDGTGNFTELMNTGISVTGFPIQGLMRDFDNDGWVDVVTSGSEGQMFRNNGDLTFSEISNMFDDDDLESLALGDLNGDGYLDIYGGYAQIFNNPGPISDKLWINQGGTNNYFAVLLEGRQSNRNGIGARVEIYGDWGMQVREVRSGESYGISNSSTSYFGLGESESIDSLIVRWPSGLVQTGYDLSKNTKLKIIEGECIGISPSITITGPLVFCLGDSVTFVASEGYDSYLWSDGSDSTNITVSNSGVYSVEIIDSFGCLGFSESFQVIVDPVLNPEIVSNGSTELCEGEIVILEVKNIAIDENLIFWSNGDVGYSSSVETSGNYNVIAKGVCSDFESNVIQIKVFENPDAPEAMGDSIKIGEIAILNGEGGQLVWFDMEDSQTSIGFGESIEIEGLTVNSSFFVEDRNGSGFISKIGMEDHEGTLYSQNLDASDAIIFDVFEPFTLDSIKVYTDIPGRREIVVYDKFFFEIAAKTIDIPEGESTLYLGFEIPTGINYRIQTEVFQNYETTGFFGPRLQRSSQNINFPYTIENVVSLKGAEFGQEFYYYFYDWDISSGVFCPSERTEVDVIVDELISTYDFETESIKVYPNPSNGKFTIEYLGDISGQLEYSIVDLSGKILFKNRIRNNKKVSLDLDLSPGIYILQYLNVTNISRSKIVIE